MEIYCTENTGYIQLFLGSIAFKCSFDELNRRPIMK